MACAQYLQRLAADLASVSKTILGITTTEIIDASRVAWDDDGSGNYAMNVGTIHEYCIVKIEECYLFGLRWLKYKKRHFLVSFGGDEFFNDGYLCNPWCEVYDQRLTETVQPLVTSRLQILIASWNSKQLRFELVDSD